MKKKLFSGFTLIELLVVITIIGILAALAIPAIGGALRAAKKAEARTVMSGMQTAVNMYQTEYNTYPPFITAIGSTNAILETQDHWKDFYTVMVVPPSQSGNALFNNNNPRQISFFTVATKYLDNQADPTAATYFTDPWEHFYKMWVDTDYNNVVNEVVDISAGSGKKNMPGSVLVWSSASDSEEPSVADVKQSVGTWK